MIIILILTLLAAMDLTVCICEQTDRVMAGTGFNIHYTSIVVFVSMGGVYVKITAFPAPCCTLAHYTSVYTWGQYH